VPDEEYGEIVKAVVVPSHWDLPEADLAERLITHCRARLSHYKCPRSVDFVTELPRGDNGKLYKRELTRRYRAGTPPAGAPGARAGQRV
jgi:acyl-coenzyme A synthetase/AMP-(fatty) acid ligase